MKLYSALVCIGLSLSIKYPLIVLNIPVTIVVAAVGKVRINVHECMHAIRRCTYMYVHMYVCMYA